MKKIITSDILDPNIAQPFTGKSLTFLQDGLQNAIANVAGSINNGTPLSPLILWGCVQTDIGSGNFSCSAGAIMYLSEIYVVDVVASVATTATTSIFNRVITNDPTADPLIFTDAVSRNVHKIRKAAYVDTASATDTLGLYTTYTRNDKTFEKIVNIGDWDMDATASLSIAHGVTGLNIRSVTVMIRADSTTEWYQLNQDYGFTGVDAGNFYWDGTNIIMSRYGTGFFDGVAFNATTYNRGFITIRYTL